MSQHLLYVEVGRNCIHFGVNYGKGRFPVPPQVARAMERSGDLAKPLSGAETTTLDEYDAERLKKDVAPPADLRSGFGLAQFGGSQPAQPAQPAQTRTDNTFEPRRPTPFDMGADTGGGGGARGADDREGNFLLTGDEDDDPANRAPEAGREDLSGIVAGAGGAGAPFGSGASGGAQTGGTSSGGSPSRSGVLIAQANPPLGGAAGAGESPQGFAQTAPGQLTPIQTAGGGETQKAAGASADADDPGAETSTLLAPPVADANAPLKGGIPDDFPKRTELANAGITSLEQLSTMNREQLLGVRGVGEKSADTIGLRLYEMTQHGEGGASGGAAS